MKQISLAHVHLVKLFEEFFYDEVEASFEVLNEYV